MTNLQKSDIESLRSDLFDDCGVALSVSRAGTVVAELVGVPAKMKFEDADRSDGRVYEGFVDFLFSSEDGYSPQIGDVVSETFDGAPLASFVVRPVAKEIWKYDDPYDLILRVHAQRIAGSGT